MSLYGLERYNAGILEMDPEGLVDVSALLGFSPHQWAGLDDTGRRAVVRALQNLYLSAILTDTAVDPLVFEATRNQPHVYVDGSAFVDTARAKALRVDELWPIVTADTWANQIEEIILEQSDLGDQIVGALSTLSDPFGVTGLGSNTRQRRRNARDLPAVKALTQAYKELTTLLTWFGLNALLDPIRYQHSDAPIPGVSASAAPLAEFVSRKTGKVVGGPTLAARKSLPSMSALKRVASDGATYTMTAKEIAYLEGREDSPGFGTGGPSGSNDPLARPDGSGGYDAAGYDVSGYDAAGASSGPVAWLTESPQRTALIAVGAVLVLAGVIWFARKGDA